MNIYEILGVIYTGNLETLASSLVKKITIYPFLYMCYVNDIKIFPLHLNINDYLGHIFIRAALPDDAGGTQRTVML